MVEYNENQRKLYPLSKDLVRQIAAEVELSPEDIDFVAIFDRNAVLRLALAPGTNFLPFDGGQEAGDGTADAGPRAGLSAASDTDVFSEVTVYKCGRQRCGNGRRRIKVQYSDGSPSESWCERCPT